MADEKAIRAVCEAICHILRSAAKADNLKADFQVYGPADFKDNTVKSGVTIFLYRVLPNLSHRTPAGGLLPNGHRQRTKLPLDLHLLLTVWSKDPDTEHLLVAWMMRTLEDYPTIPASILNIKHEKTFATDESIELVIGEMGGEEILHLWEVLGERVYHITIPYVARMVTIESRREELAGEPMQVRALDLRRLSEVP